MTAERWLPVVGFERRYEVSDLGAVRSMLHDRGHLMRARTNGSKYVSVDLRRDGKTHTLMVHAVVASAFHGPRPDGAVIRHLNGDATDNRAANLRYGTPAENAQDAVDHGTHANASKTHCKAGHPLEETARINPAGARVCRICIANNSRSYKARRRAAALPHLEHTR